MAIYTHGGESDPRRDGCDSCTDLRAEVDRLNAEIAGWRVALEHMAGRHLKALSDIERPHTAADPLMALGALHSTASSEVQKGLIPDHPEAASAPSPEPDSPQ